MSTHHMEAPAAPSDPVDRAIKKYGPGVAVPELTASSPDEVLIVHLHREDPTLRIAGDAEQAYQRARYQFGAPVGILDAQFAAFRDRNRALVQAPGTRPIGTPGRTHAEWQRDIALIRSCLDYREQVRGFVARWEEMTSNERQQEISRFEAAAIAKAASFTGGPVQPPDWRAFLARLAGQGITVLPAGDGKLTMTNADKLKPEDRAILTLNKAAILTMFGCMETI